MKICIPTVGQRGLEEKVSEHFGGAPYFTIADTATDQTENILNQNQHHSHGQCHPLGQLAGRGIEAVVCTGMGRRAIEILNEEGIKVFIGTGDTVKTVVDQFKKGILKELAADQGCTGHDCH